MKDTDFIINLLKINGQVCLCIELDDSLRLGGVIIVCVFIKNPYFWQWIPVLMREMFGMTMKNVVEMIV